MPAEAPGPHPPPHTPPTAGQTIDRLGERTRLRHHLARPECSLVLVVGQAGIGKSAPNKAVRRPPDPRLGQLLPERGWEDISQASVSPPWGVTRRRTDQPQLLRQQTKRVGVLGPYGPEVTMVEGRDLLLL